MKYVLLTGCNSALDLPTEQSEPLHPTECVLNYPATWENDDSADIICSLDQFDVEVGLLAEFLDNLACICAVGP